MDFIFNDEQKLYLDEDGDIKTVDGQEAIAIDIKSALRLIQGEYFLNELIGIDYFNEILIKNNNLVIIESLIKDAIISRPGVLELTAFQANVNTETREMTIDFSVKTIEGNIDITEVL